MAMLERFEAELPLMTSWRHDFHAHPEIGFHEVRTSGIVADLLGQWGIAVSRVGDTGVVGTLAGKRPGNRTIGLRADIDALPMQEETELAYKSTTPGAFHGCGHDGHTSILLGAAKVLAADPDFAGTVHFIFQPAEETLYGAKTMIAQGLFERFPCDEVYGLHNFPGLGVGKVAVIPGAIMAACDCVRFTVKGTGAHGAMPHLGNDPVVVAGQLIVALQSVISRNLDPLESGVVSVCQVHGGSAFNVIPAEVALEGTIRAMSKPARALLHRRVREISAGVASAFNAVIDVDIIEGCPPTINTAEQTDAVVRVAHDVVGEANFVAGMKPVMGSEDFSFMLDACKGAYFVVGQDGPFCHHPSYQFDDAIMPVGAAMFAGIVRDRLGEAG